MTRQLRIECETWRLKEPFIIARGSRLATQVVKVTLLDDNDVGMGECVPSDRYGETAVGVAAQIEAIRNELVGGLSRERLQHRLPPGSARNAVDAALWDLEAKQQAQDVGKLSGLGWPGALTSAQTVSIASATEMGQAAAKLKHYPVIKIKLDESDIAARVNAIRDNAPDAILLIDANESWSIETLARIAPVLYDLGVTMIEQPLAADNDDSLRGFSSPLPLFADESCHTRADLPRLIDKYDGINIKLDKAGGLTEAMALLKEARSLNFDIMVGCMVCTSLGIAPAMFVAQHAHYIDIDAPTLLAHDRNVALHFEKGSVSTLPLDLWGGS